MPQQIDVPGMGIIEFPDGMNDAQIAAAIKQNMPPDNRGMMDKLTGTGGQRYQTWPERMVRGIAGSATEAVKLPNDVYQGKAVVPRSENMLGGEDTSSIGRVTDLAAIATPVNPAVRAGDRAIPGVQQALKPVKPKVPTTQELAKAGAADINAAKQSGLEISASAFGDVSRKIQQDLYESGVHPVTADSTFKILKELENAPSGAKVTAANIQSLRETLGGIAQNFNPNAAKDQLAATRAIKQLDQLLPSIDPKDVLAGTPAATAKLFERGRANYGAGMRSNDLTGNLDRANTGILERAETRAQAANSGRNLDNTIRSKVAALLEKPKEVSGFSEAELNALQGVADGTRPRNTARYIGNLLGGGGGAGQFVAASVGAGGGAVLGGPVGAALGAAVPASIGATSKSIANALAKKSIRGVDELIRTRSPLYEELMANPKMAAISPERRAAFVRALLLSQQQQ